MNQEIAMSKNKNTYFSAEVYAEYTCDMADKVMKAKLGDNYNKYIQEDSEGNTSYTEEGQDMFIEILDDFKSYLAHFGMFSEEDRDDTQINNR
jgi:hypothetical protein